MLQDNFAGKKDYCKYFFENYGNQIDDKRFNTVRNLLYVACSRAKINLHVIYRNNTPDNLLVNIKYIFPKIHRI